jgi:transcriptional regulator with XRE-family HTH domain
MHYSIACDGARGYSKEMEYPVGKVIRKLVRKRGLRVKDLIVGTGLSRTTVHGHLKGERMPKKEDREKYASLLRVSFDDFETMWQGPDDLTPLLAQPSGVRPNTLRDTIDVDLYTSVSAARRDEREGERGAKTAVPAGYGRRTFVVTLDGDCMEPLYHDGGKVVFSIDVYEREGIVDGKSYFLQFEDGSQTFKRVFLDADDREELILRTYNEKYPERRVRRSDVKLMARAVEQWAAAD